MVRLAAERREIAREFPEMVDRMKACVEVSGRDATEDDVIRAWCEYSDGLCAIWLALPDSDDQLLSILLAHWPDHSTCISTYVMTLTSTGNDGGDIWIPLPADLSRKLGWKAGQNVEVTVSEGAVIVALSSL
jgi:hypothetical protein